jgi:murein endopeptidase
LHIQNCAVPETNPRICSLGQIFENWCKNYNKKQILGSFWEKNRISFRASKRLGWNFGAPWLRQIIAYLQKDTIEAAAKDALEEETSGEPRGIGRMLGGHGGHGRVLQMDIGIKIAPISWKKIKELLMKMTRER